MGFFSDFVGSFTGSNEREAARKAAKGFQKGIQFTKEQIEASRRETLPLMQAAFQNISSGMNAGIDVRNQALKAQLQLLGAGTEALSPEGSKNALTRGTQSATDILMGNVPQQRKPLPFTPISANPLNPKIPEFTAPLLGVN